VDTAEIIEGPFPHTPARVDVWQIGCIIYGMMRGLGEGGISLGGHLINVEDVIKDTDDDRDYHDLFSADLTELVEECLSTDIRLAAQGSNRG
jgi:hypothetical protein